MDTKLEISYLNTTDEERRKLCEKSPTYYVPLGKELKNKVTFEEGKEFCENIGGRMAVIGRLHFERERDKNPYFRDTISALVL